MKNMFKRLLALAAALTLVLSVTAVTCSAVFTYDENDYTITPLQEDWDEGVRRD